MTFVVDESQESGGLGAISGMASQFGFNIEANGTFSQINIQEILLQRVLEAALLEKGEIDADLLINHHIDFNEHRKPINTSIENIYFTR